MFHRMAFGFWAGDAELFLPFEDFPWFRDAPVGKVLNVQEPSPGHFYWPDLDVARPLGGDRRQSRQIFVARPAIAALWTGDALAPPPMYGRSASGTAIAVRLLVVLHHRHQGAADRQPGAVQGVDEPGRLLARAPKTRLHAPGLEIAAIGAPRDLAIGPWPGSHTSMSLVLREAKPMSPVHSATGGTANSGGAHLLGAAGHALVLLFRGRSGDRDQLDLVNWCWRIMPRVSLPAAPPRAEARRQRREAIGQIGLGQDAFADEVRERNL